jgi:hypothetical protein
MRLNGKPLRKASPLAEGDRLDLAGLTYLCLSRLPDESAEGAEEVYSLAGS